MADRTETSGEAGREAGGPTRLVIFDVNETLSDMSPMAARFESSGVSGELAATWFAGLLRDGFALTVCGANPAFADLATESLRGLLHGKVDDIDAAAAAIMSEFSRLPTHPDVAEGVRALHEQGLRLVTLSNGSTSVAQGLFERNGIDGCFERLLTVEDAPAWKPARSAYAYALEVCRVEPAEAMLVAVHPWDIHGASRAGLDTAWINRLDALYPTSMERGRLEVSSLTGLAAALALEGAGWPEGPD